jgi:hypothetical protein
VRREATTGIVGLKVVHLRYSDPKHFWTAVTIDSTNHCTNCSLLIDFIFANIHLAEAQQSTKVYRVGVLSIAQDLARLNTDSTALKGLRDGLKEAG